MTIEEFKNKLEQDKALKAAMKEAIEAGREQEFLAAQGVETGKQELSDDELDSVAGGEWDSWFTKIEYEVIKADSRGNPIRWLCKHPDGTQEIVYYTCPNCGRELHRGWGRYLFCDPCDDWFAGAWGSAVEHIETV